MLNPIAFSEGLLRTFLQYQRSAYPFSSPVLNRQLHELLDLDKHRHTPLHKGPYVSLSQPFREGAKITDFVSRGIFHPHLRKIIPKQIERLYGHQQTAVESIHEGHPTVVSTGTGSGKTETFMYPIISRCLFLRDEDASPGITAVIVYPMNALAEDQLDRLRGLLAGTEITFGMYVGKTPENESEVQGKRLPKGSTAADYQFVLNELRDKGEPITVHPYEELCSRQALREKKPRILLTNIKQLELLLTRQVDAELFDDSRLEFLVFDEAHTFSGQIGAETACLIRRLKQFAAADKEPVCIATSATITNKLNIERKTPERFAHRLFGVPQESVAVVREEHDDANWSNNLFEPLRCDDASSLLPQILATIGLQENVNTEQLFSLYETLIGQTLPKRADRLTQLHTSLLSNKLSRLIHQELR
ncbi:MAG: DEAD/DEAH box helicase, partial [Planctomycetaceae bacterium]|nr:DEAD/DEAH box helicase [Planctomycetaceae bacterium]